MSRPSVLLAVLGVLAFSCVLALPMSASAMSVGPRAVLAAGSIGGPDVLEAYANLRSEPPTFVAGVHDTVDVPVRGVHVPPPPARFAAPAAAAAQRPALAAPTGFVIASWYGPGFYGNRTACGQLYTPEIMGVAHKTLPCGTLVEIAFRDRAVVVPVIDRGPFIPGRELDLSNATRAALACTDLCTVRMQVR
ncbi:MAG TPA: septal ring lytic transglycosylase RlpA family protein [Candidatus Limnocylindria bacterium]|nr:septal ring lytic transglycosylase RlpA family protein [Candidatus Limnocylindria bacterium]